MPTHLIRLFPFESISCSVATGNNAVHFACFPQERALFWKTTMEKSLQVPREPQGFALLVVVSAVSWKMVWNWEDPGELWEGKLHPSQLLTNGKRKHQSDKPGAEVSDCGFKGFPHPGASPAESCPSMTGCPCSLGQGGHDCCWVWTPAQQQVLKWKLLAGSPVGTRSHSLVTVTTCWSPTVDWTPWEALGTQQ